MDQLAWALLVAPHGLTDIPQALHEGQASEMLCCYLAALLLWGACTAGPRQALFLGASLVHFAGDFAEDGLAKAGLLLAVCLALRPDHGGRAMLGYMVAHHLPLHYAGLTPVPGWRAAALVGSLACWALSDFVLRGDLLFAVVAHAAFHS